MPHPLFPALVLGCTALLPAAASAETVIAPVAAAEPAWWAMLGDDDLAALVRRALQANLDLEQAAARLDQATATSRAVRASLLPSLGADASAAAIRQSLEDPQIRPFAALPGFPREQERYSAGVSATWEIDLFGSASRRRSARANAQAAAADIAAARVAVAAEVATSWLTIRELQARRLNLQAQQAALAGQEAIVRRRIAAGTAAELDGDRIAAERASQAAATAVIDGLVAAEVERLGVLIADAGTARVTAASRAGESFRMTAPPIDELKVSIAQRPDVIAADRRAESAAAAVGAARSLRFPRISLGGLLASVAFAPAAMFTEASQTVQGSAALSLPLLDFGRIDAEIAGAKGRRRAALAAARQVALEAAADVARSAALLDSRRAEAAAQEKAFAALAKSRGRVGDAYAAGTVDLDTVLDVERSRLGAEDGLIVAQAETMKALVSLFRASAQMS